MISARPHFFLKRSRRNLKYAFLRPRQPAFQQICTIPCAFRRSGRSSGFSDRKSPASQHQIGEAEQRKQLRRVLSYVSTLSTVVEYTPGKFYERELPCIQHLLCECVLTPQLIVVDGYVFLDGRERPGLGKYLFDALGGKVPIVGIAKTSFAGIGPEFQVVRGASTKPLYVTCVGIDLDFVKNKVLAMHGIHRIPTLLKAADQLCRTTTILQSKAHVPG